MSTEENRQLILQFWALMNTNDFRAVSELLHEGYVLDWPQSGERVRGRAHFVVINEQYPAHGRWKFTINQLMADENGTVTDVTVTDGTITARAITFSEIQEGQIIRQTEYWPDPFDAAAWRAQWVEMITDAPS